MNMLSDNFDFLVGLSRHNELVRTLKEGQHTESELRALRDELLRREAYGAAMYDLLAEVLREISALDAGRTSERRLSDPTNRAARTALRTRREGEHLRRLSGGRLRLPK